MSRTSNLVTERTLSRFRYSALGLLLSILTPVVLVQKFTASLLPAPCTFMSSRMPQRDKMVLVMKPLGPS